MKFSTLAIGFIGATVAAVSASSAEPLARKRSSNGTVHPMKSQSHFLGDDESGGQAYLGLHPSPNKRELQEDGSMSMMGSMSMDVTGEPDDDYEEYEPVPLTKVFNFPDNYSFTASFDLSTDETLYVYEVAVAGNEASITTRASEDDEDNTVLYFNPYANTCDDGASYQVSKFQVFYSEEQVARSERICWIAPNGFEISEGVPTTYKSIVQLLHALGRGGCEWVADPTYLSYLGGRAIVWRGDNNAEIHQDGDTGEWILYRARFAELGNVLIEIRFDDFKEYDSPNDVPNASITDEEKDDCSEMTPGNGGMANVKPCSDDIDDTAIEAALEDLYDSLTRKATGSIPYSQESAGFPDTGKEYESLGSSEEQEEILSLKSFIPEMVGRDTLRVRDQRGCGSCYSFAASHTIGSTYAMANPEADIGLGFSSQRIMNCATLGVYHGGDSIALGIDKDAGSGCWGSSGQKVMNMLVHHLKGKMALTEEVPYEGIQGYCNPNVKSMDTGITGYMRIETAEEMKNALY